MEHPIMLKLTALDFNLVRISFSRAQDHKCGTFSGAHLWFFQWPSSWKISPTYLLSLAQGYKCGALNDVQIHYTCSGLQVGKHHLFRALCSIMNVKICNNYTPPTYLLSLAQSHKCGALGDVPSRQLKKERWRKIQTFH